jgi:hypothetical protein
MTGPGSGQGNHQVQNDSCKKKQNELSNKLKNYNRLFYDQKQAQNTSLD